MSHAAKGVRILLVGDDGVGKTSLILSLVTEEFPDEVPSRAEEITIPADVTPEKVPTHIVDFSYADQSEDELRNELELADVVCVVYAMNDDESVARITSYWLPIVFTVCGDHRKPVVLVGNKSDLVENEGSKMDDLLAIMDEYPEVETCIECSAFDLKNISELFYYAQKAVLHPTAPLYSHEEQQLTTKCQDGLIRIFKICDMDNDGLLNDNELNEFQKRCFKKPLPPHALQEVKSIIHRNMEEGLTEEGVTLPGFLFLHTLMIQKGRQETTWTALRRFGYGDNLDLREDYLQPNFVIGDGCCVELSSSGLDFVMELFYKYDQDEDDALSPEELDAMVELCEKHPWKSVDFTASSRTEKGWITAEGFVAQWILWTFLNHEWTLNMFAEFGYIHGDMENQFSGFRVTKIKDMEQSKQRKANRSVYLAYVVGDTGVGKTSFMQSFLSRTLEDNKTVQNFSNYSINSVQLHKQEVHVIFEEINCNEIDEKLLSGQQDVTCFLYDVANPNSFSFITAIREKYKSSKSPSIFIGNKADLSYVKQKYKSSKSPSIFIGNKADLSYVKQSSATVPPNEYAVIHSSYPLQYFSSVDKQVKYRNVFNKIATLATHSSQGGVAESSYVKIALSVGLALSIFAGVGFLTFRYIKKGPSLNNS